MAGQALGIKSTTLIDGSVKLESAKGSALLAVLAPGVLLYTCRGVLARPFHPPMIAPAQREVEQTGALLMFVDGWELHSIDTEFREAWTEWFKQHRHHFRMRLLVRSKLMDMAASLANLFTGTSVIKTYSSVPTWELACAADHEGFRRRAPVWV
jgi:hypothetical protein